MGGFVKRFISTASKKAFRAECFHPVWLSHLPEDVSNHLLDFIEGNSALFAEFEAYKPKPIDAVYNARITIPEGLPIEQAAALVPNDAFFTHLEIRSVLTSLGLWDLQGFETAQFVSPDFTCRDGVLVHRFVRLLPF